MWKTEQRSDGFLDVIRALHRSPDCDAFAGSGSGNDPLRLDVQMLLSTGPVRFFEDVVGLPPFERRITVFNHVRFEDIVSFESFFHREHCR